MTTYTSEEMVEAHNNVLLMALYNALRFEAYGLPDRV